VFFERDVTNCAVVATYNGNAAQDHVTTAVTGGSPENEATVVIVNEKASRSKAAPRSSRSARSPSAAVPLCKQEVGG
jgi:hypothetical protein